MRKGKWFLICLAGGALFLLLLGAVTMLLWNWLVPTLFNGPELGFLQAVGLFLLAKILFGGGWGGKGWRSGRGPSWRHRYHEKLSTMTPEDRERFKSRMWEKWCSTGAAKKNDSAGSND